MSDGEIVYKTAYFNSAAQIIINNLEITKSLELSKQQVLNKTAVWISEGSGWTIQSVDNHYLNIIQYQPMKGSSYIKLPQELRNSKKRVFSCTFLRLLLLFSVLYCHLSCACNLSNLLCLRNKMRFQKVTSLLGSYSSILVNFLSISWDRPHLGCLFTGKNKYEALPVAFSCNET